MERRGRTDIWPEVNDVSNLTLLDKILRDARRGLPRPCVNRATPSQAKCNLKLQESTGRTCADRGHLSICLDDCYRHFERIGHVTFVKLNDVFDDAVNPPFFVLFHATIFFLERSQASVRGGNVQWIIR